MADLKNKNLRSIYSGSGFGVRLRSGDIEALSMYPTKIMLEKEGVDFDILFDYRETLTSTSAPIYGLIGQDQSSIISFVYGAAGEDFCIINSSFSIIGSRENSLDDTDIPALYVQVDADSASRVDSTPNTDPWIIAVRKVYDTPPIKDVMERDHYLTYALKGFLFGSVSDIPASWTSDGTLVNYYSFSDVSLTADSRDLTDDNLIFKTEYNVLNGFATIANNFETLGNIDVGGGLTVDEGVSLGTDSSDEILLKGNSVNIANIGGSSNINLMFDGAYVYGDQVLGVEPTSANAGKKLEIRGQSQASTTSYNGGGIDIKGGSTYGGVGGAVEIFGGESSTSIGGKSTLNGGDGYTAGGAVEITGGDGDNGNGGNVTIRGGAGSVSTNDGAIYIGTTNTKGISIGSSSMSQNISLYTDAAITVGGSDCDNVYVGGTSTDIRLGGTGSAITYGGYQWITLYSEAKTILTSNGYTPYTFLNYDITNSDYIDNTNKTFRFKCGIKNVSGNGAHHIEFVVRKGSTYINEANVDLSGGEDAWIEITFGAYSSTNSVSTSLAVDSSGTDIYNYDTVSTSGHGSSDDINIEVEIQTSPTGEYVHFYNATLELIEME